MKLIAEDVVFQNGSCVSVTQENWDIGTALQAEQQKAIDLKSEDPRLQYFREKIWPVLFAPSSGDVPTVDQAFAMVEHAPADLDNWYKTVQRVNAKWFTYLPHNENVGVTFSDGSSLVVCDGNVPSVIMKLNDLEQAAIARDYESVNKQVFAVTFYAKFAACSIGDVPDEEEARTMPSDELDKWYKAVKDVNPHWFDAILKAKSDAEKLLEAAEIKKKPKPRRRK